MSVSMCTSNIPRTNDAFVRDFGPYVAKVVYRLNRRSENFADILQGVWLRLLEADFLGKFWERLDKSRPCTLTTEEVCLHLGITTQQWLEAHEQHLRERNLQWLPVPLAGDPLTLDALWSVDDIERCEQECLFGHTHTADRHIPRPNPAEFRTYLQRAISNAFLNWVRSHSRHHKERVIDAFPEYRSGMQQSERYTDELLEYVMEADMSCDLLPVKHDVNSMVQKVFSKVEASAQQQEDFFSHLAQGYTFREAAIRLGVKRSVVARLQVQFSR